MRKFDFSVFMKSGGFGGVGIQGLLIGVVLIEVLTLKAYLNRFQKLFLLLGMLTLQFWVDI